VRKLQFWGKIFLGKIIAGKIIVGKIIVGKIIVAFLHRGSINVMAKQPGSAIATGKRFWSVDAAILTVYPPINPSRVQLTISYRPPNDLFEKPHRPQAGVNPPAIADF
jgi:hypothetical protein